MDIAFSDVMYKVPSRTKSLFIIPEFNIRSGSRVLIEGPSGSGKSTFLNLLSGQFLPNSGEIKVSSIEITKLDSDARCRFRRNHIGIIFQRLNLVEHLTALENMLLGKKDVTKADLERCDTALEKVGLQKQAEQKSGTLSLGEQQRVAVARIVAFPPDVILADEPTSSLDSENALQVIKILFEAANQSTLIVVSHDQRIQNFFNEIKNFKDWVTP